MFSLPAGTKMFQFPAFAHYSSSVTGLQPAGLSHSEIAGSRDICSSPTLFAAYHVLLRLQEPRHPPYALSYLLAVPYRYGRCLLKVVPFSWIFVTFVARVRSGLRLCDFVLSNMSNIKCACSALFVENNGFEPLTPCLQSRCSSQLS